MHPDSSPLSNPPSSPSPAYRDVSPLLSQSPEHTQSQADHEDDGDDVSSLTQLSSPAVLTQSQMQESWDGDRTDIISRLMSIHGVPAMQTPNRRPSLSEASTSGPVRIPIVRGNREEQKAIRRQEAEVKRQETLASKRALQAQKDELAQLEYEKELEETYRHLENKGIPIGDLCEYVFNPRTFNSNTTNRQRQWDDFFAVPGRVRRIMGHWTSSSNSSKGRQEVIDYIEEFAEKQVRSEAKAITESRVLQRSAIDRDFVLNYSLGQLNTELEKFAPFTMRLLSALSTSPRQGTEYRLSAVRQKKKSMTITAAAASCLGEFSWNNNAYRKLFGIYLYGTGIQRQPFTVIHRLGLTESYTHLVRKPAALTPIMGPPVPPHDMTPKSPSENNLLPAQPSTEAAQDQVPGTENMLGAKGASSEAKPSISRGGSLYQLSQSCRMKTRWVAYYGLYATVYDNINYMAKVFEQVLGRKDTQENGTCATIWPLHDTTIEDLDLEAFKKAFDEAGPLQLTDILHSPDETSKFRQCLVHTILRIIVNHGGEGFARFRDDLERTMPETEEKLAEHITEVYPLPSWPIDESKITGADHVDAAIVDELKLTESPNWMKVVRILAGDQLSVARWRSLATLRAGQETGHEAFDWGAWIIGLFHVKIADMHGLFATHYGKPNTGGRNPASLWAHNTQLNRIPISPNSLPTFRICRDLVFISLYARILHCLLLVSKKNTLEEYLKAPGLTWEKLEEHAIAIYDQFANASVVEKLRSAREAASEGAKEGDMVFENAVLFMRDALISREFHDAVKYGDPGRILLVMKIWALSFRGNGRTKYAHETLHVIHNLTHVWPTGLRNAIIKNWLVNLKGKRDSFHEVDLLQEHLNFWIKVFYKAHGSNGSWEWLEMISPCVEVLRKLANKMKQDLGQESQGTRHSTPDTQKDIETLMKSLIDNDVYSVKKGRVLDDSEAPAPDSVTVGLQQLTSTTSSPIDNFNAYFKRLQNRRHRAVVLTQLNEETEPFSNDSTSTPQRNQTNRQPVPDHSRSPSITSIDSTDSDYGFEDHFTPEELQQLAEMVDMSHLEPEETLPRIHAEDVALDMDDSGGDDVDELDFEEMVEPFGVNTA